MARWAPLWNDLKPRRRPVATHDLVERGWRRTNSMVDAGVRGGDMSIVRVHNFSVSLDGFGTGVGQSLESPFGHAGSRLHQWFFPTRSFQEMQGNPDGGTGVDDAFAGNWVPGIGAEIMGRNKFGPQRG